VQSTKLGGKQNEGKIISKADLRKMQDHKEKRQSHGYLRKPEA
jgi:hypothetical protein